MPTQRTILSLLSLLVLFSASASAPDDRPGAIRAAHGGLPLLFENEVIKAESPAGSDYFGAEAAWFTYGEDTASGQRWLTAQGPFDGSSGTLELYETTGGLFDDPQKPETHYVGTFAVDFSDCAHARIDYEITAEALSGTVHATRLIPGSEAMCEELVQ